MNDGLSAPPAVKWGQVNVRLGGYFQAQSWIQHLSRAELKRWLHIDTTLLCRCGNGPQRPYTAAHLRRGDYVNHPLYCTVSKQSYTTALKQYQLQWPVVWVEEDHPRRGSLPDELSFVGDFVTLMQAAVLLRANSTFSWWAAVLGDAEVYSPVVEDRVGEHDVPFVKGNWPRCADTTRVGVTVTDLHLPD